MLQTVRKLVLQWTLDGSHAVTKALERLHRACIRAFIAETLDPVVGFDVRCRIASVAQCDAEAAVLGRLADALDGIQERQIISFPVRASTFLPDSQNHDATHDASSDCVETMADDGERIPADFNFVPLKTHAAIRRRCVNNSSTQAVATNDQNRSDIKFVHHHCMH